MDLHFDQLRVGDQLTSTEHDITQDVIDRAAVAHLDFNPVHVDLDWAARAQVFGTPATVAHGIYTLSVMTSVITRAWYAGGARVAGIDAKFTKPVPVGQTLRCSGRIRELHPLGPGRNAVVVVVTARDSTDEVVATGEVRVRIPD